jgi:hypothetical protein
MNIWAGARSGEARPLGVGSPAGSPRLQRRSRRVLSLGALALVGVLVLTLGVVGAGAHQWGSYKWPRHGAAVNMYFWDQTGGCGTSGTATNDALYDIYYNPHPIYIYCTNYHTDISVFTTNEPGAPYCGLAEIWASGSSITHGHARWNSACTSGSGLNGKLYQQQIFCQEATHTLGQEHSNTGDCMGGSYYAGSNGKYFIGSTGAYLFDWDHVTNDLYNRYRY